MLPTLVAILVLAQSAPTATAITACAANDAQACIRLAHMYRQGKVSGWIDLKGEVEAFQKGALAGGVSITKRRTECDAGNALSCYELARIYGAGWSVLEDRAKGFQYASRACELRSSAGCFELGVYFHNGIHVARDPAKAVDALERGCIAGSGQACDFLGSIYYHGWGPAREFNNEKAATYFERACALRMASGCYELGVRYATGVGVSKDLATGRRYFKIACDAKWQAGCDAQKGEW